MPNLLDIERGCVTAPAGCGKTHLIATSLANSNLVKPVLIITHTNAGVAALRARLVRQNVPQSKFRLQTLDGFALRLVQSFPQQSGTADIELGSLTPNVLYPQIRTSLYRIITSGSLDRILKANFSHIIIDEYQDCNVTQHAIATALSEIIPTCVLGDPMQALFTFNNNPCPDWEGEVCRQFPVSQTLNTPWRWDRVGENEFGAWLLGVREDLLTGRSLDLRESPAAVKWLSLDVVDIAVVQRTAALTRPVESSGKVLIIGDSRPVSHRTVASLTPGATTAENVDLRDLTDFGDQFDLGHADALRIILTFAGSVMTGVSVDTLLTRINSIATGRARNPATEAEAECIAFKQAPSILGVKKVLEALANMAGSRIYRDVIYYSCLKALDATPRAEPRSFDAMCRRVREQSRYAGRPLARKSVGSTLLFKGLESDTAVILNASDHDAKSLYVAMTRGERKLVICSANPIIQLPPVQVSVSVQS